MNEIRPSWEDVMLTMAVSLSRRSTCSRLHVGCVIASFDHRQIFSGGYNGGAAGLENECESLEPGACGHLHAEENACIACTAPRDAPKVIYVTYLPCVMCCKRLINLGGVKRVVFKNEYRIRDGLDLLERARIDWQHVQTIEADMVLANLTATQARCTDLLEENRRFKEMLEKLNWGVDP